MVSQPRKEEAGKLHILKSADDGDEVWSLVDLSLPGFQREKEKSE